MNTKECGNKFIQALKELDRKGEVKPLVDLFAGNAVLFSPVHIHGLKGRDKIERFWRQYRDTFKDVSSRFSRILRSDNTVVLEWISRGHLAGSEMPFEYAGATILECDENQKIRRFNTYYDTTQLLQVSEVLQPISHEVLEVELEETDLDYGSEAAP